MNAAIVGCFLTRYNSRKILVYYEILNIMLDNALCKIHVYFGDYVVTFGIL